MTPACSFQGIANELLTAEAEKLHVTVRKLVAAFRKEFEHAKDTGKCASGLWLCLTLVRILLKADVHENEGINSLLSRIGDRCRSITLPVLDARVKLKKALGVGCSDVAERWSCRKAKAKLVHAACMDGVARAIDVIDNEQRWEPAAPSAPLPTMTPSLVSRLFPAEYDAAVQVWASPYCMALHVAQPKPSVAKCFSAGRLRLASAVHFVIDKNRYAATLAVGTASQEPDGTFSVHIPTPLQFMPGIHFIARLYDTVRDGDATLYAYPVKWNLDGNVFTAKVDMGAEVRICTMTKQKKAGLGGCYLGFGRVA